MTQKKVIVGDYEVIFDLNKISRINKKILEFPIVNEENKSPTFPYLRNGMIDLRNNPDYGFLTLQNPETAIAFFNKHGVETGKTFFVSRIANQNEIIF
jgi:hypothetical protein